MTFSLVMATKIALDGFFPEEVFLLSKYPLVSLWAETHEVRNLSSGCIFFLIW